MTVYFNHLPLCELHLTYFYELSSKGGLDAKPLSLVHWTMNLRESGDETQV